MNCHVVKELASDYLDRRLGAVQAADVREHVRLCAECREEIEQLRATVAAIGSLEEIEVWPDFLVQVNRKIDRVGALARIRRALFEPLRIKLPVEAAGLVIVATLGLYLYHREAPKLQRGLSYQFAEQAQDRMPAARREKEAIAQATARAKAADAPAAAANEAEKNPVPPAAAPKQTDKTVVPAEAGAGQARDRDIAAYQENMQLSAPVAKREEPAGGLVTDALMAKPKLSESPPESARAPRAAPPPEAPQALRRGVASEPQETRITEISSRDPSVTRRNVKAVLDWIGGEVLSETESDGALVLSVALPRARQAEFRSVLQREGEFAPGESSDGAFGSTPRTKGALAAAQRTAIEEKKRDDHTESVTMEIRIRQKE